MDKESPLGEEDKVTNGSHGFGDYDVELSLCGEFFQQDIITPWDSEECLDIFYKYLIPFEDYWFNPAVTNDQNLIVRINGRQVPPLSRMFLQLHLDPLLDSRMYRSSVALPLLMSLMVYRKLPSKNVMKNLIKQVAYLPTLLVFNN